MAGESLWRDLFKADVEIDQRLHGLHFLVGHEAVVLGDGDEMDEAHVEDLMLVDMVERVLPVTVVQVTVTAEHLFHEALAIFVEGGREPARLADPVLGICCIRRLIRGRSFPEFRDSESAWSIRSLGSRKHDGIMDLAHYPALDAVDELRC